MAISKKTENTNYEVKVTRVKQFDNGGIRFDLNVNGVTIYNMSYVESSKGAFCSFPSKKEKDGKYYSHCYFRITEEIQAEIEKQIESLL